MEQKDEKKEIGVEISPQVVGGVYSNLVIVNHTDDEFVLDFATLLPGISGALVQSRVILVPRHARALLDALQQNIQIFDSRKIDSENVMSYLAQQGNA